MKLNASKLVLAATAAVIAAGALTACEYGVDRSKGGKTAAQKERNKCKGNN